MLATKYILFPCALNNYRYIPPGTQEYLGWGKGKSHVFNKPELRPKNNNSDGNRHYAKISLTNNDQLYPHIIDFYTSITNYKEKKLQRADSNTMLFTHEME